MTNVGPGFVYGLFLLGAPFLVAAPVLIVSHLMQRRGDIPYAHALGYTLLLHAAAYGAVGLGTGFSLEGAATPALLGILYVSPIAPAAPGVRLLTRASWDASLRHATQGWVAGHGLLLTLGLALPLAGAPSIIGLVADTPPLLGIAGLSGYLAYLAGVALASAIIGARLENR